MKANVKRGKGFLGLLRYALDRGVQCAIVGGNMVGLTPNQLSREFAASRRQRRKVERPVWHATLSLPPGETLAAEAWDEIAHSFMRKMRMPPERHQFVVVRHTDTACEHVHVIASRIGLDASLWHGVNEALVAQVATQELELEYGLTITKGPNLDTERPGAGVRAGLRMSQAERELWAQRDAIPPKAFVAQSVALAISRGDGTPESLREALAREGIEARISIAQGRVSGISYALRAAWDGGEEDIALKGSQIGGACDAKSIERRLAERRAEIGRTAAVLRRAQDLRLENELRAASPERLARLAASAAATRRRDDAEEAAARDRGPGNPAPALGDDAQGRSEPPGPASPARPRSDGMAEAGTPAGGPGAEAGRAAGPAGPVQGEPGRGDRRDRQGGGGPADPGRAAGGTDQNGPDVGIAGGSRQQDAPDGATPESDRGDAGRAAGADAEADGLLDWTVQIEVAIAVWARRQRRRHDWYDLARRYRAALAPHIAAQIQSVRSDPDGGAVRVVLHDGTRIEDTGDRISAQWQAAQGVPAAAEAMADMARIRGWNSIRIRGGDEEFRRHAWLACQRAGIGVDDYVPPPDLLAVWKAERAAARRAERAAVPDEQQAAPEQAGPDPTAAFDADGAPQGEWFAWFRLAKVYRHQLPQSAAEHIKFVRSNRPGGPVEVGLRDASNVTDHGQRVSTAWRESAGVSVPAATVMAEMARAKGWRALRINGGDEQFRRQAWLACQRVGLEVRDYAPPADLVAAWTAETAARMRRDDHGQDARDARSSGAAGPVAGQQNRGGPVDRAAGPDRAGPGGDLGQPGRAPGADVGIHGPGRDGGGRAGRTVAGDDRPRGDGGHRRGDGDRYKPFTHDQPRNRHAGPDDRSAAGNGRDPRLDDGRRVEPTDGATDPNPGRSAGRARGPGRADHGSRAARAGEWDARFKRASAERRRNRDAAAEGGGFRGVGPPERKQPQGSNAPGRGDDGSPREPRTGAGAPGVGYRKAGGLAPGPSLPYQTDGSRAAGRGFLAAVHGIPASVLRRAEKAKFLHHCENGIAFLGMGADRRAVAAWLHPLSDGPGHAMANSVTSVPPVFPGDPRAVLLCTDGVAALRALAKAERAGRAPPTVIVLYGGPENALRALPADLRTLVGRAESVRGIGVADTPILRGMIADLQAAHTPQPHQPDDDPSDDPTTSYGS